MGGDPVVLHAARLMSWEIEQRVAPTWSWSAHERRTLCPFALSPSKGSWLPDRSPGSFRHSTRSDNCVAIRRTFFPTSLSESKVRYAQRKRGLPRSSAQLNQCRLQPAALCSTSFAADHVAGLSRSLRDSRSDAAPHLPSSGSPMPVLKARSILIETPLEPMSSELMMPIA
jgi:hypothetical protein